MAVSVKNIILYTKNIRPLASFLGALFETEVSYAKVGQVINIFSQVDLLIVDRDSLASNSEPNNPIANTSLEFTIDHQSELADLFQKVHFLHYRVEDKVLSYLDERIQKDGNYFYFEMKDSDHRMWRFSSSS